MLACSEDPARTSLVAGGHAATAEAAAPAAPLRAQCASNDGGPKCLGCAANEVCFTQVTCGPLQDGGSLCTAGETGPGDDRCHRACNGSDAECPAGERCVRKLFSG